MKDNPHHYKTLPLGHFINYKSTASLSPQFTLQSDDRYNLQETHFHNIILCCFPFEEYTVI